MNDHVISVDNLSKKYVISHLAAKGDGLSHQVEEFFRSPWRWIKRRSVERANAEEEFWALRNVSFQIKKGEAVGIIGRNGAGKSTLLKVLSRITEPTEGCVRIRGRVSSLLEVGTGFHAELTGRENIFLNGAILGMSKGEIKRKFDEIVAFAEVDRFLDTPVKRYSSGMYVRLAFAVAAHLEPEILIVDEVLAVGDANFQKKCLNKMNDVGQRGRTVFFVSHNIQAVTRLCGRCIFLQNGEVKMDGPAQTVASAYTNTGVGANGLQDWSDPSRAPGDEVVRLRSVRAIHQNGEVTNSVDIRRPVGIAIEFEVLQPGHIFHPHFGLRNDDGVLLFVSSDSDVEWQGRRRPPGRYVSTGWIPGNYLTEGGFSVIAVLMTLEPEQVRATARDAVFFRVVDCFDARDTARGDYPRPMPGLMRPLLRWTNEFTPKDKSESRAYALAEASSL